MEFNQGTLDELMLKAQQDLTSDQQSYKRKLNLYVLMAYGVILLLLLLFVGLVAGTVGLAFTSSVFLVLLLKKKLIIPLLIIGWMLGKVLFLGTSKPEGYRLRRTEAPLLFGLVNELTKSLNTPRVHNIIITPEFNAAMAQTPRWFVGGPTENTLIIGLELLMSLSKEELKAVLAHELGHLSGDHAKFNGKIYRARAMWEQMMHSFESSGSMVTYPMRKFFSWYAPRFSAYSFALARLNEYEADLSAAKHTSAATFQSALVKTSLLAEITDEDFWPQYYRRAYEQPAPDILPYTAFKQFMDAGEFGDLPLRLAKVMAERTSPHNTHPCTKDRVEALGTFNAEVLKLRENNAWQLLGKSAHKIIKEFNDNWLMYNGQEWQFQYQLALEQLARLKLLDQMDPNQLSLDQKEELAFLLDKFQRDPERVVALYDGIMASKPHDLDTGLRLAQLYAKAGNPRCLPLFRACLAKDELVNDACMGAYGYYLHLGDGNQANEWLDKLVAHGEIAERARQERITVGAKDPLMAPTLPKEAIDALAARLIAIGRVEDVWLCQKSVQYFRDSPVVVLAIKVGGWTGKDEVLEQCFGQFPADWTSFIVTKDMDSALFKKVQTKGSQII
ncbi:M48 family metallopeptidase [Shewanella litorisediminis]|uniref:M48 family metalloprotease n=1 Tax=Shewanella litorisediminis TaxID=1173586 RepID=A0ABX7G4V1_9GAMM|nr:M48 family metallopeptidase [Shewanella litorisediminis]MCL2917849.1 M48 family metalloprotease [Shewanella litorisediminis]QRH02287.1 M48 family metalloprotease [Shewanella litorisediminis]